MRIEGERESDNIEDRRGESYGGSSGGGGMPIGGMTVGGGIGTVAIILVLMLLRANGIVVQPGPGGPGGPGPGGFPVQREAAGDGESKRFVSVVLADTEDVWHKLFQKQFGRPYRDPKLVLFTGQTQSGCGFAGAATGPFYCPADEKVYLDLGFFDQLREEFHAPGDFAAAYVIAHEVGHHVQNQLGVSEKLQQARGRVSKEEYNRMSVRLELQADFLAGVWAHHAQEMKHILDAGDIEEAMKAAAAVGDDRLQKQARGRVAPESFTHGTSEQRSRWFKRGFETGDVSLMDELFKRKYSEL